MIYFVSTEYCKNGLLPFPSIEAVNLTFVICRDESEDVIMPEHDRLVDLAFPDPRVLVPAVEDLDGDVFSAPMAEPDLAKPEQDRQSFQDEH